MTDTKTTDQRSPEARARAIMGACVAKGDLTPKAHALLSCIVEEMATMADRLAALERAQRKGESS
jgi:hypothetical protein